jgi:hypothetical protein
VHAALSGYLIGVARRQMFPRELVETLIAIAVSVRALAAADRAAPSTHLALAGVLDLLMRAGSDVDTHWNRAGGEEWERWKRDRSLLRVAGAARIARTARAWQTIEGR